MPLTNLLLNVFIILLSIPACFSLHHFWDKHDHQWIVPLVSSLVAVTCMLFPFHIFHDYTDNFGFIVLFLAILYGSHRTGIFVTVVVFVSRYLIDANRLSVTGLTLLPVVLAAFVLSRRFIRYSRAKKVTIVFILEMSSIVTRLLLELFQLPHTRSHIVRLLVWGGAQLSFFVITLFFIETLRNQRSVELETEKRQRNQLLVSLTSAMAHDIRSPLTVCTGFAQLLREMASEETQTEYVTMIQSELNRASSVVARYLSFSEEHVENTELIDIAQIVTDSISALSSYAVQNNVKVNASIKPVPPIRGDSQKLRKAFVNIMKNGIEAMPQGGTLTVRVYQNQHTIGTDIVDTGIGMSPEQLRILGYPFYSTTEKGTGLSLMIAYRFIHLMNGQIRVTSKLGKGTQFTVTFQS